MTHKANISMNKTLYAWLSAVGARMGARSVPGTARAILTAVMRASASHDAEMGMMSMIGSITMQDEPEEEDAAYISEMMEEYADRDRNDPTQRGNIRNRK